MNKFLRNVGFYLLIILIAISIIDYFSTKGNTKQEIDYTEFLRQVETQSVEKVTIVDDVIRGKLTDGTEFTTITPNDPMLISNLREKGIEAGPAGPAHEISVVRHARGAAQHIRNGAQQRCEEHQALRKAVGQ